MAAAWKLPGYVVEGLLGRGGTGTVWLGRVARSGEAVALKSVPMVSAAARAAVQREAAVLAALDHPNLVRLHELVLSGDRAILVMDLAAGGSLADLIAVRGRLAPGEVITALAPVAAALAHAHAAAVVHGDVSAANVLFTDAGRAMLADLGVARLLGDTHAVHCTPAYVDPAVAAGAPPTTHSDVFMLGGVALHALTGSPTWPSDDAEPARGLELDEVSERLADAGVPEQTARVVRRALDADPHRRGTAADFALDLRHSGEPVAVELAAGRVRPVAHVRASGPRHAALPPTRMVAARPRPVLPRRADRALRWRRLAVGAALVAAAVALGLAATAWWPWRSGDPGAAQARTGPVAHPSTDPWLAALTVLDARRSAAYARRNADLLDQVYATPALLRRDTATLRALVPATCRLAGLRTVYAGTRRLSASGARAVVVSTVRVAPASLVCAGRSAAAVPGSRPVRLRIELVRTSAGIRIVGLTAG